MLGYQEIDTDLHFHKRGKGGLVSRNDRDILIKELPDQHLSDNRLMNFGIENIYHS